MHSNYNLLTLSDSRLLNSNGQTIYYKERIEGRNMKITDTIKYVGVNDHQVDLFEGQYRVPNGISYNSYIIMDDKIAIMDTVDIGFVDEWLANVKTALGSRKPDYLVVQHMEPDHSASIKKFLKAYPDTTIVGNAKTFVMMGNFFRNDGLIFSISIPLYVLICPALLQLRTHLRVELTMQRIGLQHNEAEDAHGE